MSYLDEGPPRRGCREVVVMLHGNPSWSYYWRHLVLGLRDRYRCIVPDHVGMGLSDKPGDDRLSLHAAVARRRPDTLLDHLGINGPVTLAVHDWGGMIGFGWALSHRGAGAALVDPQHRGVPVAAAKPMPWQLSLGRDLETRRVADPRLQCVLRRSPSYVGVDAPMPADVRRAYVAPYDSWAQPHRDAALRAGHSAARRRSGVGAGRRGRAQRCTTFANRPAFIGWGLRDFVFDEHFLEGFTRALPQAEVHAFEDAGHYVLEDKHEVLVPAIRRFLDSSPTNAGEVGRG